MQALTTSAADDQTGEPMETTPEKQPQEVVDVAEMTDNGIGLMLVVLLALTIVAALAM
jgi:hypothetical protein